MNGKDSSILGQEVFTLYIQAQTPYRGILSNIKDIMLLNNPKSGRVVGP